MRTAFRNSVIHNAETFGPVPLNDVEESTMNWKLNICNRVYKIAKFNTNMIRFTIKKYSVNKPPRIQIQQRRKFFEASCLEQLHFEWFKGLSQVLEGSIFVDNYINQWMLSFLVISALIFKNYFDNFFWIEV